MRILHLAYEDPRQPGSGGGAIRTREVDRRLAIRHEVTAIATRYPGATDRVEDGVRWHHVGPSRPARLSRLGYFAALWPEVRARGADVVVEDFGAPFSVGLTPLVTTRPVVASVQWLFAAQMRDKYRLPFHLVESLGLRCYTDFMAVSDWLAAELRARRPGARVETIPNGVDRAAFEVAERPAAHLLFMGRLDREQKGLDLLVAATRLLASSLGESMPPVIIAGDGPDRSWLEAAVRTAGLEGIVRLVGQVAERDRFELMAGSHAVLMPSRFETFGMVAAEALAAGVPLVTFDVGPLAEVAGPGGALLVAPFDVPAFARAVTGLIDRPERRVELARRGRRWARRYDWDRIADAVEAHLEDRLAGWRWATERG